MTNRQTVYVAGYPKSGTTWLTWLLADALDSPAGGSTPKEDRKELATEGAERTGPYIVRKGHFVLMEGAYPEAVPSPHRLVPGALQDERVVWIARDPRDVAVSAAHYFKSGESSIKEMLHHMGDGTGPFRSLGRHRQYISSWLNFNQRAMVRYEDLLKTPLDELRRLMKVVDLDVPSDEYLKKVIERQSFARKSRVMQKGKRPHSDIGRRLLREGRSGSWRLYFDKEDRKLAAKLFNNVMVRLGYIGDIDWWKHG